MAWPRSEKWLQSIRARAPRLVLFAARGTSDNAAIYGKYFAEILLELPVGLVSPSTLTAYASRPDLTGVLVVVVSQSGGSPDLVETAAVARTCGATVLAVTNAPESALAEVRQSCTSTSGRGPSWPWLQRSRTRLSCLALWLLVDAWREGDAGTARSIPEAVQAQVGRIDEVTALAQRYRFTDRMVLTGRGYSYPTVREGALKLMETSYLAAHAFSGADLLHGPLAMIDSDHPVVAVVPEGPGGAAMLPVLEALRDRQADLAVIGHGTALGFGTVGVLLDHGLPEELSPLVDIVALQHLALVMAVGRGFDPDQPRGLSKVTLTW